MINLKAYGFKEENGKWVVEMWDSDSKKGTSPDYYK